MPIYNTATGTSSDPRRYGAINPLTRQTRQMVQQSLPPVNPGSLNQGVPISNVPSSNYTGQANQPQQYYDNNPQTGLIGSEQALQAGLQGSLAGIQQGSSSGLNLLRNTQNLGLGQIGSGAATASSALTSAQRAGQRQLEQGSQAALGNLNQAQTQGLRAINQPMNQAIQSFNPYARQGRNALGVQGALSGAMGREAQQQAYNDFLESPGQAFLREQGERSILNTNAATGGVGGGNILKELTRYGQGMAAQDFGNSYNRLAGLSQQGLQAIGQQAGLRGQQASMGSGLISNLGQARSNVNQNLGTAGANLTSQMGSARANVANQAGMARGNLTGQMGMQGAGILNTAGQNVANLYAGTAGQVAQDRLQTGQQIAQAVGNTGSALSALANQQGQQLAGAVGTSGNNIAQLLQAAANGDANALEQLGVLQANIATGQGSTIANQPIINPQSINYSDALATTADAAGAGYNAWNGS